MSSREKWKSLPLKARLTGRYWRTRHRLANRWMDLRAWWVGYCNDNPWRPEPGSGYSHWRCGRQKGHGGLHRSRNYVWGSDGRPEYVPQDWPDPVHGGYADQPWARSMTLNRRQTRAADAWHRAREAERRASS